MVDDLLDLSQLDAGRVALSRRLTDVVALARTVIEPFAVRDGATLFPIDVEGAVPHLFIDPDRISQILENLLSNAVRHGAPGRPVVVRVRADDARAHITVSNEGAGIPTEDLTRIFARFERGKRARDGAVKGYGLGLFIVHELVTAHGGEIDVESPPKGPTTFTVSLPLESERGARANLL